MGQGNPWNGLCLVVMSILLGGLACPATGDEQVDDGWRRTAQGWERVEAWRERGTSEVHGIRFHPENLPTQSLQKSGLHPLVLLGLQLLLSLGALRVLSPTSQHKGTQNSFNPMPARRKAA